MNKYLVLVSILFLTVLSSCSNPFSRQNADPNEFQFENFSSSSSLLTEDDDEEVPSAGITWIH